VLRVLFAEAGTAWGINGVSIYNHSAGACESLRVQTKK
jgi:hypothetical protein